MTTGCRNLSAHPVAPRRCGRRLRGFRRRGLLGEHLPAGLTCRISREVPAGPNGRDPTRRAVVATRSDGRDPTSNHGLAHAAGCRPPKSAAFSRAITRAAASVQAAVAGEVEWFALSSVAVEQAGDIVGRHPRRDLADERGGACDDRSRRRRSPPPRVPPTGIRAVDVDARRGQLHPRAAVGEVGSAPRAPVVRGHGDDLRVRRRPPAALITVVAGGGDDHDVVLGRVLHELFHDPTEIAGTEAHVDDPGAPSPRFDQTSSNEPGVAVTVGIEDTDRQDPGLGRHQCDDPGDVGAVAERFVHETLAAVVDAVGDLARVGVAVHDVDAAGVDASGEIGVFAIDPGVEHCHDRLCGDGQRPYRQPGVAEADLGDRVGARGSGRVGRADIGPGVSLAPGELRQRASDVRLDVHDARDVADHLHRCAPCWRRARSAGRCEHLGTAAPARSSRR